MFRNIIVGVVIVVAVLVGLAMVKGRNFLRWGRR